MIFKNAKKYKVQYRAILPKAGKRRPEPTQCTNMFMSNFVPVFRVSCVVHMRTGVSDSGMRREMCAKHIWLIFADEDGSDVAPPEDSMF